MLGVARRLNLSLRPLPFQSLSRAFTNQLEHTTQAHVRRPKAHTKAFIHSFIHSLHGPGRAPRRRHRCGMPACSRAPPIPASSPSLQARSLAPLPDPRGPPGRPRAGRARPGRPTFALRVAVRVAPEQVLHVRHGRACARVAGRLYGSGPYSASATVSQRRPRANELPRRRPSTRRDPEARKPRPSGQSLVPIGVCRARRGGL